MGLYDVDVVARGDGDAAAKLMHYCPRLSPSVASDASGNQLAEVGGGGSGFVAQTSAPEWIQGHTQRLKWKTQL